MTSANTTSEREVLAVAPTTALIHPSVPATARARIVVMAGGAVTQWLPYFVSRVTRTGRTGVIGAVLFACSLLLLLAVDMPQRNESATLRRELATAGQGATGTVAADPALGKFVAALPRRADLPLILGQMVQQANEAGIQLDSGRYELVGAAGSNPIARYRFSFPLQGSYPNIRKFINGTLAAIPATGVDSLRIERNSIGEGNVVADLRLIVFVRNTP